MKSVKMSDANIAAMSMQGMTKVQIAEETNLERRTVAKILDKPAIRQMMLDALEGHGFTLSMLAKKNIDMLNAKKEILVQGNLTEIEDNVAQITAMKEVNSIYGVHAPKQLDVRASAAEASVDELANQVEASLEELDMVTELE